MSSRPGIRNRLGVPLMAISLLPAAVAANVTVDDPTRPLRPAGQPASATAVAPRPTLESVLIGSQRRVAVIDGQRLSEGESRGGLKIWRIEPEGVEVSVNGSRMVLKMPRSGVRKSVRRPLAASAGTGPADLSERAGSPAPDHEDLM